MKELNVSIIIPTYNRRRDVFRAIRCVLAQTVPVSEIIVVDDGSTDDTVEAVKQSFGSQVLLIQQPNSGVSAARNLGIKNARTEWIALLDSDDWWHPDKLKRQFTAIESLGGTSGVCFTDNVYGGNPGMTFSRFEEVGFRYAPTIGILGDTAWRILAGREPFFTSSFLIRRALLEEAGGFDETLTLREDTDLLFRLSFKAQFCFVREPLTEIDRTPSRTLGLCNVYGTRSDVVFDCSTHIYRKWLAMPEVIGSWYEAPLREMLRDMYFASAESKIRQLRIMPAMRNLAPLMAMGDSSGSIVATLLMRKMRKTKRELARRFSPVHNRANQPNVGVT